MLSLLGTSIMAKSSMNELEDKKDNLQQNIKNNKGKVKNLESNIKDINGNIDAIENKILAVANSIDTYETQLTQKQVEIKKTKEDLEKVKEEEEQYLKIAKERIKVMYEYGNTGYLEVLFNSDNLYDFFYRAEYVNKIMEYDEGIFTVLEDIRETTEGKEQKLIKEEAAIEHLKAEADLKKGEMEDLVVAKTVEKKKIESNKESLLKEIKRLEREQAKVDAEIKNLMGKNNLVYSGGKFMWPLPGWYRISSDYGYRYHPITNSRHLHGGIDIPASYGTNVLAGANGKVIIAKYNRSYGNYIVIDHGSGYSTVYAHNSKLLVKVGDTVTKGSPISKVGSTGSSTGNHLHFEVRINNKRVNPIGYVKSNK
jgi:murein DD-endopeptidase MepM/ murein hydrolase activator NlpD